MNTRTFIIHSDPGHAWLEVPMGMIHRLGIADKISSCSYRKGDTVYLEEDCDAPLFTQALKSAGVPFMLREKYEDPTPIRDYDHYYSELRLTPETIMELLSGKPLIDEVPS
jgi:hypothetical protein